MSEEKDEKLEDFDEEDSNQDSEQIEDGEKPLDPNEVTEEEANKIKGDALEGVTEGIQGGVEDTEMGPQIKSSFLEYAMSVIVARALPDARDGFKPVHRRIIYGMNAMGMQPDKPFKKSARIVGDVMGKYHPHGDSSIYDAMARLAQDFAMRYPLVDGHGNYGSQDGDEPAAMRYTEARMSKLSLEMIREINKNTVDFVDTYDGDGKEPVVLPARLPNLLINGSSGIAVGMATNIPPHNLTEVINGAQALIKNPDLTPFEIMNYIKGPDFPGGGIIMGRSGIRKYFETGSGSVCVRGKYQITEKNGRTSIVFTELPYMVNKKELAKKIMDLVNNKTIEGITGINDYSSHKVGTNFQIDLKKGVNAEITLNHLFKYTKLEDRFAVNMLALDNGIPKVLNIKQALEIYIRFQCEVIERRTKFDLEKSRNRMHILEGLIKAVNNIDEVIRIIREQKTVDLASAALIAAFGFSEAQAKAILEMRMYRLVGLEIEKLENELTELKKSIEWFESILASHDVLLQVCYDELEEIKKKYGDERRTDINESELSGEDEDLIEDRSILIALTNTGYIKRMDPSEFKVQNRGGIGVKGMSTKEDDSVQILTRSKTKTDVLFFTSNGRVFRLRGYQIPEGSRQSKGIPIVNLLQLGDKEKVLSIISVEEYDAEHYLFFVTRKGVVKRCSVDNFERINRNGKIAIELKEDDTLVDVKYTDGNCYIILGSSEGKVCMFKEEEVRSMGRTASGVKGMNLEEGGHIVGVATSLEGENILSVSEKGLAKMTNYKEYRLTKRGSKGVITMRITERTGALIAIKTVKGDESLLISTDGGTIMKTEIKQISVLGRNSSGVKLITLRDGEAISSMTLEPNVDKELEKIAEEEPVQPQEDISKAIAEELNVQGDDDDI